MDDNGTTKDDVKVPDGEVGDKINKMFKDDGKDCSTFPILLFYQQQSLTSIDVIVLAAMGEESAIDVKEAPK